MRLRLLIAGIVLCCGGLVSGAEKPNVVILFADDMGYGDLGCFGAKGYETPHLDRMARDGVKFTSFYVSAAGCSPSRASLLTGCYAQRIGVSGIGSPSSNLALHHDEITIAEVLKDQGYKTGCFGKWHQGWRADYLPPSQGFDVYFGLPYSHDMSKWHATHPEKYPDLPLVRGVETIEINPDPTQLTKRYTEEAVKFIEASKDGPFFCYVPYNLPHVPLFVSKEFEGKTKRGLYGDVVSEIDASVGTILGTLKRLGLDEKTLVIFTSDNGPWLQYGDHGGSAGPLREGKGTTFEGGMRMPCVMRWTGKIPAGIVCDEVAATIDLLPTIARLAGTEAPTDRIIDGKDIWPLMSGAAGAVSPHEAYYFYSRNELQAVRSGKWKLHYEHKYRAGEGKWPSGGIPVPYVYPVIEKSLFDLESDIGERVNLIDEHPEVLRRLEGLAERMRRDIGDSLEGVKGVNWRPVGRYR